MFKLDLHTRNIFLAGFITWCVTFGGAWITYTNAITELQTNQATLMKNESKLEVAVNNLAEKVSENTTDGAVTTSVLISLNATLAKIDGSLDTIVNETTKNSVRLDNLERE